MLMEERELLSDELIPDTYFKYDDIYLKRI